MVALVGPFRTFSTDQEDLPMSSFDKITGLVELKKERVLIGDGEMPFVRDGDTAPFDIQSIKEYDRFLTASRSREFTLKKQMSPDEIETANRLYAEWFQGYLTA